MNSELGRFCILWTVRLSVLLYALAVWRWLFATKLTDGQDDIRFRTLWTGSWLFCVIHVVAAFHFEHHWSHAAALRHTADMTERVVGIHWGGGLYINFAYLTWWGIEVVLFRWRQAFRSSVAMQATAAFMMFNATAVFGPSWWWIPVGLFVVFVGIRVLRKGRSRPDSPEFTANNG